MSTLHKDVLRLCWVQLVDDMSGEVLIYLFSGQAITEKEYKKFRRMDDEHERNAELLLALRTKPDVAFDVLVDALEKTWQGHLASRLKDSVGQLIMRSLFEAIGIFVHSNFNAIGIFIYSIVNALGIHVLIPALVNMLSIYFILIYMQTIPFSYRFT